MPLVQLATGATPQDLAATAPLEAHLPEQTPVQLSVQMRSGAETVAQALDWVLRRAGVQAWGGSATMASGDKNTQVLTVQWVKASVGLPIIAAALGAGGITALLLSLEAPEWVFAALAGAVVVAVLVVAWSFFRRAADSVGSGLAAVAGMALPAMALVGVAYVLLEAADVVPYELSIRKHLDDRVSAYSQRQSAARLHRQQALRIVAGTYPA